MKSEFVKSFVRYCRAAADAMEAGDARRAAYFTAMACSAFAAGCDKETARYMASKASDFMFDAMEEM